MAGFKGHCKYSPTTTGAPPAKPLRHTFQASQGERFLAHARPVRFFASEEAGWAGNAPLLTSDNPLPLNLLQIDMIAAQGAAELSGLRSSDMWILRGERLW